MYFAMHSERCDGDGARSMKPTSPRGWVPGIRLSDSGNDQKLEVVEELTLDQRVEVAIVRQT